MSALMTCPSCLYAHVGAHCSNPGCTANPTVSEAQKERWAASAAKLASEGAERERVRAIRRRMSGESA